jgi:hypothetical protein
MGYLMQRTMCQNYTIKTPEEQEELRLFTQKLAAELDEKIISDMIENGETGRLMAIPEKKAKK